MFGVLFFSSRRRHTRCALVTGVQTCALPIYRREIGPQTANTDRALARPIIFVPPLALDGLVNIPSKVAVDQFYDAVMPRRYEDGPAQLGAIALLYQQHGFKGAKLMVVSVDQRILCVNNVETVFLGVTINVKGEILERDEIGRAHV